MSEQESLYDIVEPDFLFSDDRGTICQLTHDGFKQTNVVFTKKGKRRGQFHYHLENEERFFIVYGKVQVELKRQTQTEKHIFGAGEMFQIHREVRHDFVFLEDTLLIGFYDVGIELYNGMKDIYTDEQVDTE